ncbi:GxxExxY protein [Pollutibacter soli]|uniref:GxxExxY protein n=1 Tax=Pollutibacter soli TaxID=3034157 RepID=UPI0030132CA3
MKENELTQLVIGKAIEVHNDVGPGVFEHVYKEYLALLLRESGLLVEQEKPIPFIRRGIKLNCGYRMDLLVENKLVLEIKSVEAINDAHLAQLLTYLRLGNYHLGLIINFNVVKLKSGIRRVINGHEPLIFRAT